MHKVKPQEVKPFDLPVRILMVTCRPDGAGFIDPRSIATPLLDALDALPDDLRTAIVLRELEGMSYEEIANAMECPIGTVRSRIFRAREAIDKRLRPLLEP